MTEKKDNNYNYLCIIYGLIPYVAFIVAVFIRQIINETYILLFTIVLSLLFCFILLKYEKNLLTVTYTKYHLFSNCLLFMIVVFQNVMFCGLLSILYDKPFMPNTNFQGCIISIAVLNIFNLYYIILNTKLLIIKYKSIGLLTRAFYIFLLIIQFILPMYNFIMMVLTLKSDIMKKNKLIRYWTIYYLLLFSFSYFIYKFVCYVAWF